MLTRRCSYFSILGCIGKPPGIMDASRAHSRLGSSTKFSLATNSTCNINTQMEEIDVCLQTKSTIAYVACICYLIGRDTSSGEIVRNGTEQTPLTAKNAMRDRPW